jgi:hypothetical protein
LREDRSILLMCFGISLLFWFFVKLSQEYEVDRLIEVQYELPPEKAFIKMPPASIPASLKGKGWDLLRMYFDRPAQIELQAANQFGGRVNESLLISKTKEQLRSRNMEVLRVENDLIDLRFEDAISKVVPVRLRLNLEFEAEHQLSRPIQIFPDSVRVHGPQSIIGALAEWPTDSLNLTGLKSDLRRSVGLVSPSTASIILDPSEVEVEIPVEAFVEKSFFVPVSTGENWSTDSIRVFPPSVRVNAVVGMSYYDLLKPEDFRLEVLLEGIEINSENNTAPIQMTQSPDFVRNVRFSPQSVEFIFTLQDSIPVGEDPTSETAN